jgi:hypothetical protein
MTQPSNSTFEPGEDEKLTPLMIYSAQKLIWGKALSKQLIQVSSWLLSEMAPNYITLIDAQVLIFGTGQNSAKLNFSFLNIQTSQINAYHILPPADESPYYGSSEPNRKMEPVSVLSSIFRFDASIHMATQSNLYRFLSVTKEEFVPLFDVWMTSPVLPAIKGVKSPFALIRQSTAAFSYNG